MSKTLSQSTPHVGFVCPACDNEVNYNEIVERKGRVGCVNCLK